MRHLRSWFLKRWSLLAAVVACALFGATGTTPCRAQSTPTASRSYEPSVFAGISGSYTGLSGGRNLGINAGADLGFRPFFGFLPSIEVRGTYPADSGTIVGQESVLGGLRVQKRYRNVRPYVDFLIGRGQMTYQSGGYIVLSQDFKYLQSTSTILSPGLGFETDITPHFALLLDGQLQHCNIPFTPDSSSTAASSIYAKAGMIGVVYRFSWLEHGHPAP